MNRVIVDEYHVEVSGQAVGHDRGIKGLWDYAVHHQKH